MSFQEAEAADATLTGLSDILRGSLEELSYKRNPHQVYDSMDADDLIEPLPKIGKPASRKELLQKLTNHRSSPQNMPDEVVAFCRKNLQQGPIVPNAADDVFGHVHRLDYLVDAIRDSSSGMTRSNAKALLEDVIRGGDPATRLQRQKTDLAVYTLSTYQMWSYPAADQFKPFTEIGTTRADAVNALGLGYYSNVARTDELVRWAHSMPAVAMDPTSAPRRPTAWDAGSSKGNVYWRPGGRTLRLDREKSGVTEVIHKPVRGANLATAIEALP